ncbi:MAG: hypothetical protein JST28_14075 [Acidobacteria bacterium]|nr:hypothetical protein [Acidobacteriota bacterium]
MKHKLCLYIGLLFAASVSHAESEVLSGPAINVVLVRGAEQMTNPHVITYRVAEWTQIRGKWMLPDIGYYDTEYGKDQIWFAGGGLYVVNRPRVTYYQEFYISQEAGPESSELRRPSHRNQS